MEIKYKIFQVFELHDKFTVLNPDFESHNEAAHYIANVLPRGKYTIVKILVKP